MTLITKKSVTKKPATKKLLNVKSSKTITTNHKTAPLGLKVETKKEAPIQKVKMFKGFTFGSGDKYPNASHVIMRSYTLAALKVAGFINIAPKSGLCTKKAGGSYNIFTTLTKKKVARVWSKSLLDSGQYVAKAQKAMKSESAGGYDGQVSLINTIVTAMTKGMKDSTLKLQDKDGIKANIKLFEVGASY